MTKKWYGYGLIVINQITIRIDIRDYLQLAWL